MSSRSVAVMRKALLGKRFVPALRPTTMSPIVRTKPLSFIQPVRFYTSAGKQPQSSKISSLASSPEIIQAAKVEPKPSKIKELTKKYGATGVIVYLGVGCVDLGVTFGLIQLAGLDKVKALERGVLDVVYSMGEKVGISKKSADAIESSAEDILEMEDSNPSLTSVFILAYGIHKTLLLPVRLGITAAITPAIVRKLHQLGWARYLPRFLAAYMPKKP